MAHLNRSRVPTAILASGSGTTAEAFIHASQRGIVDADVKLVVCNNPTAGVLRRVERLNRQYPALAIRTEYISGKTNPEGFVGAGSQTLSESTAIAHELDNTIGREGLVLFLGYMKKAMSPVLDRPYKLNTHPGPLPLTRGLCGHFVHERVVELGLSETAHTVHEVETEYDSGLIIAVNKVPIFPDDTPELVADAVQSTERQAIGPDVQRYIAQYVLRS